MKTTDFATLLTNFLGTYLPSQRNVSPNTVRAYRDTFVLLLRYFNDIRGLPPEKLFFKHLDPQSIRDFIDHLGKERNCSPRTQNQRLAALHAFFRFVQLEAPQHLSQCQRILAMPSKRHEVREVNSLAAEEVAVILEQPDLSTAKGRRHAVMLSLLYDTGARVQEIVDLCVQDVRLETPAQVRLTGKGRKIRTVPLMKQTVCLLEKYMKENDMRHVEHGLKPCFSIATANACPLREYATSWQAMSRKQERPIRACILKSALILSDTPRQCTCYRQESR